jgi:DNA-binding FadR family transcriptional regulator
VRQPLHHEVMAALIADVVSGRTPPGAILPTVNDIAGQFDVSRGVARETLSAMQDRGLISIKQGKSGVVSPADEWDTFDPEILAASLGSERGETVLDHYFEVRRIVESEAAALAAARATESDLEQMKMALKTMEVAATETTENPQDRSAVRRFREGDGSFHEAIIGATGNPALQRLARRIHMAAIGRTLPSGSTGYWADTALPQHRAIFDAVAAGDPEAARAAMNGHLDSVRNYLSEYRLASFSSET